MKVSFYFLKSPFSNNVYVGSTTQTLEKRFSDHKSSPCSSAIVMKLRNVKIILLEEIDDCSKEERYYMEKSWIDALQILFDVVNYLDPSGEYHKEQHRAHNRKYISKPEVKAKMHDYSNRPEVKQKHNRMVVCNACNSITSYSNFARHSKQYHGGNAERTEIKSYLETN